MDIIAIDGSTTIVLPSSSQSITCDRVKQKAGGDLIYVEAELHRVLGKINAFSHDRA